MLLTLTGLSKFISRLFTPGLIWISGLFIFSLKGIDSIVIALLQVLILLLISISMLYWAIVKLKIQIDSNISTNIKQLQNNPILLVSVVAGQFLSWLITKIIFGDQPLLFLYFSVVSALTLFLFVIRHFSNCSGHVTSISSLSFLLSVAFNISFLYFLPLIILMGYSRINLKVHSIQDVVEGFLLGYSISYIFSKHLFI